MHIRLSPNLYPFVSRNLLRRSILMNVLYITPFNLSFSLRFLYQVLQICANDEVEWWR